MKPEIETKPTNEEAVKLELMSKHLRGWYKKLAKTRRK